MPRNIRRFCCSWDFSDVAHPFSRAFDGRWEDRWDRSRQTDSFNWDTNPHTPRLYFKSAPPLHLPRHNDLLGLHSKD